MIQSDDLAAKRLGRPRDTDSADTRRRILDVARSSFAEGGYEAATNRELASKVGITAGALYHYFGSKLDLYLAVNADVQTLVHDRLADAVDGPEGFVAQFDAVLDAVHELNKADPTLAAFVGAARTDSRRHPEIQSNLAADSARTTALIRGLIEAGVASGEVNTANREFLHEFVVTLLVGLTDGVSNDTERHRRAIESIKMVFRGALVTAPAP